METEKVSYHEQGTLVEVERVFGERPIQELILEYLKNRCGQLGALNP